MAERNMKSMLKFGGIILAIVIVDVAAGLFIGTKLLMPKLYSVEGDAELTELQDADTSGGEGGGSALPGFTLPLEPINFNPSNSDGEIFSCEMTLATDSREVITELNSRGPQIKDIILTYLSFNTAQELNDVSKRRQYRNDLVASINSVLTNGKITDLYITQWILSF